MPKVPTCISLQVEHFEAILRYGSMFRSLLEEFCFEWIVNKVIKKVVGGEGIIR